MSSDSLLPLSLTSRVCSGAWQQSREVQKQRDPPADLDQCYHHGGQCHRLNHTRVSE